MALVMTRGREVRQSAPTHVVSSMTSAWTAQVIFDSVSALVVCYVDGCEAISNLPRSIIDVHATQQYAMAYMIGCSALPAQ